MSEKYVQNFYIHFLLFHISLSLTHSSRFEFVSTRRFIYFIFFFVVAVFRPPLNLIRTLMVRYIAKSEWEGINVKSETAFFLFVAAASRFFFTPADRKKIIDGKVECVWMYISIVWVKWTEFFACCREQQYTLYHNFFENLLTFFVSCYAIFRLLFSSIMTWEEGEWTNGKKVFIMTCPK